MDRADVIGNGVITRPELSKAISLWYVHSGSNEVLSAGSGQGQGGTASAGDLHKVAGAV